MQAVGRQYRRSFALGALALCGLGACRTAPGPQASLRPGGVEAVSLTGERLVSPSLPDATRQAFELRLAEARRAYERAPTNADSIIWLGRRTAYLGRYREAIAIFTEGVSKHPNDPRMYRHRGHRFITVRDFDRAVTDLSAATRLTRGQPDQTEPDGIPNALNIPTSTLQSNIWYHLGLAHYLKGDFQQAVPAYREALRVSSNSDMLVATSQWLYMSLRRLGRDAEAAEVLRPISRDLTIIENDAYLRLLLMYKGEVTPDSLTGAGADPIGDATTGYGVGNWHLYNGRRSAALEIFRRVVVRGSWAAFGHIAAEAEIARFR